MKAPTAREIDGRLMVMAIAFAMPPSFTADLFFEMAGNIEAKPHCHDLLGNNGVPMVDYENKVLYTGCLMTGNQLKELGCIALPKSYPVTLTATA